MKKRTRLLLILVAALCLCLGFGVFAACKNEPKKHVHEYTAWAHDGTYHWKVCPVDDAEDESTREEHTMVDGKCTVCDYQEAPPAHTHAYTNLVSDATNHWYECPEDNDYISQFGHIYENGKCIVCGKEGTAPTGVELDTRVWYIAGAGAGDLNQNASWTGLGDTAKFTKAETPDSNGYTVYTYQLSLYSGDEFKLVQDLDWDEGLGYYGFGNLANGSEAFRDVGSGNISPLKGHDGIYQFIIRTKPDGGATANMVEWRLVEPLEAMNVEEQYEMYIIGNISATGRNQWKKTPDQMVKLDLMGDGETFYTAVRLVLNDEYKLYNYKTDSYYPTGENNNLKCNKTALYVVSWRVGAATPTVEEYHHIHNYGNYAHDATTHWRSCVQDGEADEAYGKVEHAFGDDNFCDVCGYEKAEKPECETHTWGTDNVCTVCGRHWVYTEGLAYQINAKRDAYTVKGFQEDADPMSVKELVIPYYYNGKPVVAIADNAFYDTAADLNGAINTKHSTIKKVVLPDTVKTIGKNAFRLMIRLNYVQLGAGIEEIGENAFRESVYILSINLPEGLKTIGNYAFSDGIRLMTLKFPASLETIGSYAFQNAYLMDVTFAEGSKLEVIGTRAFDSCTYLEELNLPEGLKEIGNYAFNGASALANVSIPASVTSIGTGAFAVGGTALKNVTFAAPENWQYATSSSSADWIVLAPATAADPAAAATWIRANVADYLKSVTAHEHNFILSSNETQHWFRCAECDALKEAKQAHKIFDQHCSVCGVAHTEHTYDTKWTTDGTNHWHVCKICGAVQSGSKAAHSWNSAGTTCSVCSYRHTHTYAADYSYDENNHWKAATCGHSVKSGNAAHRFNTDNICTTCGYERIVQGEDNGTPGLAFKFTDDYTGLIVTGFKEAPESLTVLEIPAKCGNWPVVEIAASAATAFSAFASTVTKVVIPDTVKVIRAKMFQNFTVLTDLSIGSSVYKMGDYVFAGCTSLQNVTLPESLYSVGAYAFDGCSALTTINLEYLTYIGEYGFRKCVLLNNLKFSQGLKQIKGYTFQGCAALDTVDFGGVVTFGHFQWRSASSGSTVGYAFAGCGFKTLKLPDNFVDEGGYAFSANKSLTSVQLGKNSSLSGTTFNACSVLESINFENIVQGASFSGCAFKSVTLDLTVEALCKVSITNSSALTTVVMTGKPATKLTCSFSGCTGLTSVTLPEGVTNIPSSFAYGCTALTTIKLPSTVTEIERNAFNGAGLTAITLPAGLLKIGDYAFKGCDKINPVLPAALTDIGTNAFQNCTSITTVTIGDNVKKIGKYAFDGCTSLATVTLGKSLETIEQYAFQKCAIKSIVIPASVKVIALCAFKGCADLTSITLTVTEGWQTAATASMTWGNAIKDVDFKDPAATAEWFKTKSNSYQMTYYMLLLK